MALTLSRLASANDEREERPSSTRKFILRHTYVTMSGDGQLQLFQLVLTCMVQRQHWR